MPDIVLFPGNWLYNAGLVGVLRILRQAGYRPDSLLRDGGLAFEAETLDPHRFALAYFQLVAHFALPGQRERRERLTRQLNRINRALSRAANSEERGRLQEERRRLRGEFDRSEHELRQRILTASTEDVFRQVLQTADPDARDPFRYVSGFFQRLYFNMVGLGQPRVSSGFSSRFHEFRDRYVLPARNRLDDRDFGVGIPCRFCHKFAVNIGTLDPERLVGWSGGAEPRVFYEGFFAPLGLSPTAMPNFFYWRTPDLFLCELCRLVLLCSFAGFQRRPSTLRTLDETEFVFVSLPSLEDTWRTNESLWSVWQREREAPGTIYEVVLYDLLVREAVRRARWTLTNVLFVEFSAPGRQVPVPAFRYFHIGREVAELLTRHRIQQVVSYLSGRTSFGQGRDRRSVHLRTEALRRLFEAEDLAPLAYRATRSLLDGEDRCPDTKAIFAVAYLEAQRNVIGVLKEGGNPMSLDNTLQKSHNLLWALRYEALNRFARSQASTDSETLQRDLKARQQRAYRLLELIRLEKREEFYHEVVRLYMNQEAPIPDVVLSLLDDSDRLGFRAKAYAWLSGFLGEERLVPPVSAPVPESEEAEEANEESS